MDAEKETARYVSTTSPDQNYEEIQLEERPGIGEAREGTQQQLGSRVALATKCRSVKNRLHCSCEHGTDGEASASDASATYTLRVSPKFLLVSAVVVVVVVISALALSTLAVFTAMAAISKSSQTCLGKRPVWLPPSICLRVFLDPIVVASYFSRRLFLYSGKMPFIVKSADKMASTRRQDTYPSGGLSGEVTKWTEEKIVFLTWSSTQLDILEVRFSIRSGRRYQAIKTALGNRICNMSIHKVKAGQDALPGLRIQPSPVGRKNNRYTARWKTAQSTGYPSEWSVILL